MLSAYRADPQMSSLTRRRPSTGSGMRSTRNAVGMMKSVSSGTTSCGWALRHCASSVVPERIDPRMTKLL